MTFIKNIYIIYPVFFGGEKMISINEISAAAKSGSLLQAVSSLTDEELAYVIDTMEDAKYNSIAWRMEAFVAVREELKRRQEASIYTQHSSYFNK